MHLEKHNFNRKVALYNPLLTLDFKGPEKTNNKSYMILLTPFPTLSCSFCKSPYNIGGWTVATLQSCSAQDSSMSLHVVI